MAGPWILKHAQSQNSIPTLAWGAITINVEVIGGGTGVIRIQAGGLPIENQNVLGNISITRNFGGNILKLTNVGGSVLKVSTS